MVVLAAGSSASDSLRPVLTSEKTNESLLVMDDPFYRFSL
jgi:hypothetical protein